MAQYYYPFGKVSSLTVAFCHPKMKGEYPSFENFEEGVFAKRFISS